MHDELFANANRLDEVDLRADAAAVTLNMRQFDSCMRGEAEGLVRQDRELAKSLGLTGTPAFIVGRREEDGRVRATHVLVGAGALADFTRVLDLLLVGS